MNKNKEISDLYKDHKSTGHKEEYSDEETKYFFKRIESILA